MPIAPIPYLSAEEVYAACSMNDAIETMRAAFVDLSSGNVVVPVRTHVELAAGGEALFMPAHSGALGRHTVKIASIHPANLDRGLDFVQATVVHFDSETGQPLAVLEGKSVTAIRTGAGSGLATDLMARKDAVTAVIIGVGIQAETQLEAVCAVRGIERAYCISRSRKTAERFAEKMTGRLGIRVVAASNRVVLKDADVICTATTSHTPVLDLGDVKPGVHINAVGTHRPDATEIDPELVARARVIVDQRAGCMKEAGEILVPISTGLIAESHIVGELGDVVAGRVEGRTNDDEITLFKSVGNAVQDLYLAELVVRGQRSESLPRARRGVRPAP